MTGGDLKFFADIIPSKKSMKVMNEEVQTEVEASVDGSGIEDAMTQGGGGFMDAIMGGEMATDMMSGAGAGGFGGKMVSKLGGMSTALMGILGAVMLIAGVILMFESVQKMLGAFLKFVKGLLAPFVAMGLRLLAPVLGFLFKLLPMWYKFWKDPIGNLQKAFKGLKDIFGDVLSGSFSSIPVVGTVLDKLEELFGSKVVGHLKKVLQGWAKMFKTLGQLAKNIFKGNWEKVGSLLLKAGKIGIGIIQNNLKMWAGILKKLGTWLFKFLKVSFKVLAGLGKQFLNWYISLLKAEWKVLKGFGKWIWNGLTSTFNKGLKNVQGFASWLMKFAKSIVSKGASGVSGIADWIMDWAKGVVKGMKSWAKDFYEGIADTVSVSSGGGSSGMTGQRVNDLIISGNKVYRPSPRDTIMAVQNPAMGGGSGETTVNINIEGNVDSEVYEQLKNELAREMDRIGGSF